MTARASSGLMAPHRHRFRDDDQRARDTPSVLFKGRSPRLIMLGERLSPGDFAVGQHQQGAQQHDGVSGVHAQLGEDTPVSARRVAVRSSSDDIEPQLWRSRDNLRWM
ncbi:hypothetical protein [Nonomuraea jabiensis]|uniref:Uncharacterized protein n=1 Tax=Nonomuraea jabiensis TaxID=882448 RepID=A0A7W9GDF4_9ACTN|nr:hypothetical protein [Nonomuraea jabiensis]MBB5781774.1 hypothetical protein [Nonomuraea jabiensis]